jgi:methylglutaconyl-CoA hydratase
MKDTLLINIESAHIATLTLNRPKVHNAFDDELITELMTALKQCEQDPNIRVVILKANGKNFCAGADLKWMQRMAKYSHAENLLDAERLAELMYTLYTLKKPTIVFIQGSVVGGGVGLVACCDIAIASQDANFCLSEVKLGLAPAVISPYVIQAIGERAAHRYFLTAERFDANQAHLLRLIHEVVANDHLEEYGWALAQQICENSPAAITTSKELILKIKAIDNNIIEETINCIAKLRASSEGREGMQAFLEKRKPAWLEK